MFAFSAAVFDISAVLHVKCRSQQHPFALAAFLLRLGLLGRASGADPVGHHLHVVLRFFWPRCAATRAAWRKLASRTPVATSMYGVVGHCEVRASRADYARWKKAFEACPLADGGPRCQPLFDLNCRVFHDVFLSLALVAFSRVCWWWLLFVHFAASAFREVQLCVQLPFYKLFLDEMVFWHFLLTQPATAEDHGQMFVASFAVFVLAASANHRQLCACSPELSVLLVKLCPR